MLLRILPEPESHGAVSAEELNTTGKNRGSTLRSIVSDLSTWYRKLGISVNLALLKEKSCKRPRWGASALKSWYTAVDASSSPDMGHGYGAGPPGNIMWESIQPESAEANG